MNDAGTNDDAHSNDETKHARGEKGLPSRYSKLSSDVPDTPRDASVASTSSRLRRPGLPSRAGAVSQETRDQLRAARQRMYAALKRRAASGVSAEEQRWLDLRSARFASGESGESGESGVGTSARPRSFFASNGGTRAATTMVSDAIVAPPVRATNDDAATSGGRARAFEASETSSEARTRFAARASGRSARDAAVVSEDSTLDTTLEEEDPYL